MFRNKCLLFGIVSEAILISFSVNSSIEMLGLPLPSCSLPLSAKETQSALQSFQLAFACDASLSPQCIVIG